MFKSFGDFIIMTWKKVIPKKIYKLISTKVKTPCKRRKCLVAEVLR